MTQYISKAAVVAEIKRISCENPMDNSWYVDTEELLNFLDNLEVKDVDFEKKLKEFLRQYYNYDYPKQYQEGTGSNTMPHIVETAKYFFNLGLKAQKGEEI